MNANENTLPQNKPEQPLQRRQKINLGECKDEEKVLDTIEQSRRITRLIINAVQKGSRFEVSQILEHYGLSMSNRLHFKVVNIVMEQWFSLMGVEDENEIWNILNNNNYALNKIREVAAKNGTMMLSDLLTEWELPIGALQSKIIRRINLMLQNQNLQRSSTNNANNNDNNNNNNDNNKNIDQLSSNNTNSNGNITENKTNFNGK